MERFCGWVMRHRLLTVLLWLAVTAAGVVIAPSVSGRLVSGNHMGGPAYAAEVQIAAHYGGATSNPGVLILNFPRGDTIGTPQVKTELTAIDTAIARAAPSLRLVSYGGAGSP